MHPDEHPLAAELVDERAAWTCPTTGTAVVAVGLLIDDAEADRRLKAAQAAALAWFERYEHLPLDEAQALAREDGRPVRVIGPADFIRANFVSSRLNIFLDADGEMTRMEPG